jgi:murein L,D-transpeptidase YcbB/YkuD
MKLPRAFTRLVLAIAWLTVSAAAVAQAAPAGAAARIQVLAQQAARAAAPAPGPYDQRGWLERFYAARAYAPAWDAAQARDALALLRDAGADGLDPRDYNAAELQGARADSATDPAGFDAALTGAMLRYLADLHLGRVPSDYHSDLPDPRVQLFDPVERLRAALAARDVAGAAKAAQPVFPLYAPVKAALAHYRGLASEAAAPLPPLPAGGKLTVGMHYRGAKALHARLTLLGDLSPAAAPARDSYNAALADAVRRFQSRHGLEQDGVIGRDTLADLNVPLARRVRQLELTLERLRWLPDFAPGPVVAVNLPSYMLWAFTLPAGADIAPLEMRVIVGAAVKTPTPLFIGQMRYLEFNPYWNVPRSITLREIIPRLEADPGYLAREQMELVPVGGGHATSAVSAATIDALRAGRYRVRQRPGPKNSLGAVKFAMPNPMDIYLHATPARELFRRTRRDLSHGCIRVEQPVELARFVLADARQWDDDSIEAAMAPGPTHRVELPAPVPVVLFYTTAIVDREGRALFMRDVYRRDPLLEQALAAHGSQIVPAPAPQRE